MIFFSRCERPASREEFAKFYNVLKQDVTISSWEACVCRRIVRNLCSYANKVAIRGSLSMVSVSHWLVGRGVGNKLSTTAKMAAVTAGRPSRRRSRRIASACAFLSNISLDGNITKDAVNRLKTEKTFTKRSPESIAQIPDLLSSRRAELHSISEPSTSEGVRESSNTKNVEGLHRQRSVTDAISERRQQERAVVIRRSASMSESTDSSSTSGSIQRSKHRISCLRGSSFHHKRRATDKR